MTIDFRSVGESSNLFISPCERFQIATIPALGLHHLLQRFDRLLRLAGSHVDPRQAGKSLGVGGRDFQGVEKVLFRRCGIAHIQLQTANGLEGLQVVRLDGQGLLELGNGVGCGFTVETASAVIRVTLINLAQQPPHFRILRAPGGDLVS